MNSVELTTTTAGKTLTIKRPNNVTKFKRKPADAKKKKVILIIPDLPAEVLEYMSHFFDAQTLAKFSICSKYTKDILGIRSKNFLRAYLPKLQVDYNMSHGDPRKIIKCECNKKIHSDMFDNHNLKCCKKNPYIGRFVNVPWQSFDFWQMYECTYYSTYEIVDTQYNGAYIKWKLPEWHQDNIQDNTPTDIRMGSELVEDSLEDEETDEE